MKVYNVYEQTLILQPKEFKDMLEQYGIDLKGGFIKTVRFGEHGWVIEIAHCQSE